MSPSPIELGATIFFVCAIVHTFCANFFNRLSHKYPRGSIAYNFFHFLGEVEVVFGLWAGIFIFYYIIKTDFDSGVRFIEGVNYTEPIFVFVIMTMACTRPIIKATELLLKKLSQLLPFSEKMSFYLMTLILGPVLGSFITEPAAMAVTAVILEKDYFSRGSSRKFMYATLGLLFVNISIGGTLSHFAAPPVLIVAGKWGWDVPFMISHFGYKAVISMIISTSVVAYLFRKELAGKFSLRKHDESKVIPHWWVILLHLVALFFVVKTAHHPAFFLGLFLFFIGFVDVTSEYQSRLKLKESLLVGFFLAGLVTLGSMQQWWLSPVLSKLSDTALFFGAAGLTAFTDNAAITYLGSLVEISDRAKYFLVAGAVTGGGLTVIANAPNPAGFGILKPSFGKVGISALKLFLGALFPTIVTILCMLFLPHL